VAVALGGARRVVVVRALPGLGDLLCAVPALRALRAALPQARVTLVGLPWARVLVRRFRPYLDELDEFPGWPGIPERPPGADLPAFVAWMQGRRFDLAIQMHGDGRESLPFTRALGAARTVGFVPSAAEASGDLLAYPRHLPEPERHLALMRHLGVPADDAALEFPVHEEDRRRLRGLAADERLDNWPYACLHAGAAVPSRRWPLERFARVGDDLARRGLRVVLTGTAGEAPLTRAVREEMRAPAVDLAGRTDLGALAALLEGARLVVCNDTGVSHLAAGAGAPSVVVFSASDPGRWAPAPQRLHRIVRGQAAGRDLDPGEPVTGEPASVEMVLAEAGDLLAEAA
jgi:ADP-heptose:LPS heptosyltransferase